MSIFPTMPCTMFCPISLQGCMRQFPLRQELFLQFIHRGPAGGALHAAQGGGAVSFLSLGIHIQQRAAPAAQVWRVLLCSVAAQRGALVTPPQEAPGPRPAPQRRGPRPGCAIARGASLRGGAGRRGGQRAHMKT